MVAVATVIVLPVKSRVAASFPAVTFKSASLAVVILPSVILAAVIALFAMSTVAMSLSFIKFVNCGFCIYCC